MIETENKKQLDQFVITKTSIIDNLVSDIRYLYNDKNNSDTLKCLTCALETAVAELKYRFIWEGIIESKSGLDDGS